MIKLIKSNEVKERDTVFTHGKWRVVLGIQKSRVIQFFFDGLIHEVGYGHPVPVGGVEGETFPVLWIDNLAIHSDGSVK